MEEVFVVARYANWGGAKDYYLFDNFDAYEAVIRQLPPATDVIIFKQKQLPYRNVANEDFKGKMRALWQLGIPWMMVKFTCNRKLETQEWDDESEDFEEAFEDFRGEYVCVGPTSVWWENDHEDMQSGLVPLRNGRLGRGAY